MRKLIIVTISLLFVAASAFAQQTVRSNAISVFVNNLELSKSQAGTKFDTDFGLALEHRFNPRLSAELSVTQQRSSQFFTISNPNSPTTPTLSYSTRSYPIDATVSYHIFTESRWRPYIGAGLRYVSDTLRGTNLGGDYRFTTRTVEPEVSGGVTFQFTPRLGLRFDAKQVIARGDPVGSDPEFKGWVGLSLRF